MLFLFDSFLIPDPATAGGTFRRLNSGTSIERPDATLVCPDRFDVCSETPGGGIPGIDGGCCTHAKVIAVGVGGGLSRLCSILDRVPDEWKKGTQGPR